VGLKRHPVVPTRPSRRRGRVGPTGWVGYSCPGRSRLQWGRDPRLLDCRTLRRNDAKRVGRSPWCDSEFGVEKHQ